LASALYLRPLDSRSGLRLRTATFSHLSACGIASDAVLLLVSPALAHIPTVHSTSNCPNPK
jgi:hypothetical protein